MDMLNQFSEQIATLKAQQTITETILHISRGLNTARNAHDLLMALSGPAITNGVFRANLVFIDPDEHGEPAWIEVVAAWQQEGALMTPVGSRFYLPDFPATRIWIEHPNAPIFSELIATDARLDEQLKGLGKAMGVQAAVWITVTQAGRWVAQINFSWRESHPFSEQEVAIYSALAPLAGPAVENLRLITTLEQKVNARTAELMQATHEAELARELAEKANHAKSIFLANMSHELRTPLNSILGFAQILAHDPHTPEEREHIEVIIRSGEHLLTLINQVLDLAKIEAGRVTLHEQEMDLFGLLDEVYDLFALKAQEKQIHFVLTRADDVPCMIRTDEVKLRQILINLVGNALKFTNTGGVTVRVWTPRTLTAGTQVTTLRLIFEVEDTGPGMTPEELETLFTAFTQTRTGQQIREGSGLGLAISQQFVHLLGGDIRVHSAVGQGTAFTFAVQVGVVASIVSPVEQPHRRIVALAPDQPPYRLLIVDDQPDNRRLLVTQLQPFGFDLREAQNGQEAIAIWQAWQPHLIWMDLRMPGTGGYEAVQKIRELETGNSKLETPEMTSSVSSFQFPVSKIIAMSASAFEEEHAIALANGCDDFLRKPFRENEIFDLLHKHLGVRFVYKEGEWQKAKSEGQEDQDVLTLNALAGLPQKLLADLEYAVTTTDITKITALLAEIQQYDPALANALRKLVEQFDYIKILTILQKAVY